MIPRVLGSFVAAFLIALCLPHPNIVHLGYVPIGGSLIWVVRQQIARGGRGGWLVFHHDAGIIVEYFGVYLLVSFLLMYGIVAYLGRRKR